MNLGLFWFALPVSSHISLWCFPAHFGLIKSQPDSSSSPNCRTCQPLALSANNTSTQLSCKSTGLDFEFNFPNTAECSTRPVLTKATIYQPLSDDPFKPV